ncbi:hypothetical protein OG402_40980 [Streptomyces anulatus]|uniref:hypothetical protein n=1 Tax=Streptomyces anulatus TaxID=1892 RepID=UPI002252D6DF|nr:hypothetical protein [Streptomyces anulatus]MCX4606803.1 hypothetical protein [Streptomyces anulatus]
MFFPSEGDRIVITRYTQDGSPATVIGTARKITPFAERDGVKTGGWDFTGHDLHTGKDIRSAWSCSETLLLHHQVQQTVRPATDADEQAPRRRTGTHPVRTPAVTVPADPRSP